MTPPPLALYVHLPWCVRKCPYCDFNSHRAGDNVPKERYIHALLADLGREAANAAGRELHSIFLGGGTPSLFSPGEINRVLQAVRQNFKLAANAEITMEANPGTVECGSPRDYREAGITRLSIGAQSFDDDMLTALGRIHNAADIRRAVQDVRQAGFDNFNIDLMHGLPGQTVEMALADLAAAVALLPTHISWYQLTLEPNTVFYARPPKNLPDDDLAFDIQESGQALLREHGFEQYEISAYARDGRYCRHNLNYWNFGDYLAVGAGAHGKLTTPAGVHRYQKPANPLQYMLQQEMSAVDVEMTPLPAEDLVFEFMLNALRLNAGFQEKDFIARTGLTAADLVTASKTAREKELIERNGDGSWQPTDLGRRFLNDLQSEFMLDRA